MGERRKKRIEDSSTSSSDDSPRRPVRPSAKMEKFLGMSSDDGESDDLDLKRRSAEKAKRTPSRPAFPPEISSATELSSDEGVTVSPTKRGVWNDDKFRSDSSSEDDRHARHRKSTTKKQVSQAYSPHSSYRNSSPEKRTPTPPAAESRSTTRSPVWRSATRSRSRSNSPQDVYGLPPSPGLLGPDNSRSLEHEMSRSSPPMSPGKSPHYISPREQRLSERREKSPSKHRVFVAARLGRVGQVRRLVDEGINLNAIDETGCTALSCAARYGHLEVVKILVDKGNADVNLHNKDGNTALHWAASHGHVEVMQCLLVRSAAIDAKNRYGNSPLHTAARYGHTAIVGLLVRSGANVNAVNKYGDCALHFTCRYGHIDATNALLENEYIMVNEKGEFGNTPLHFAASRDHRQIVSILLNRGADPRARNNDGKVPADLTDNPNIHRTLKVGKHIARARRGQGMLTSTNEDHTESVTDEFSERDDGVMELTQLTASNLTLPPNRSPPTRKPLSLADHAQGVSPRRYPPSGDEEKEELVTRREVEGSVAGSDRLSIPSRRSGYDDHLSPSRKNYSSPSREERLSKRESRKSPRKSPHRPSPSRSHIPAIGNQEPFGFRLRAAASPVGSMHSSPGKRHHSKQMSPPSRLPPPEYGPHGSDDEANPAQSSPKARSQSKGEPRTDVLQWTTDVVGDWLVTQGLAEYRLAFAEHRINGTVLFELESVHMREELGIRPLGDRIRLQRAIDELRIPHH